MSSILRRRGRYTTSLPGLFVKSNVNRFVVRFVSWKLLVIDQTELQPPDKLHHSDALYR